MIFKVIDSPIGPLTLTDREGALCRLDFGTVCGERTAALGDSPLLRLAEQQLNEYFAGERRVFTVPVSLSGTDFQQKVWAALAEIPCGETRSYGDIAKVIGSPKACRAVGSANHVNPVPIIIPCHRVIGTDGSMTGYGGGIRIKEFLLKLEGIL